MVYDTDIPFELRMQDNSGEPQDEGALESIRVKILLKVKFSSFSFLIFQFWLIFRAKAIDHRM